MRPKTAFDLLFFGANVYCAFFLPGISRGMSATNGAIAGMLFASLLDTGIKYIVLR